MSMTSTTQSPSSEKANMKQILAPVADGIGLIDDTLRSIVTLDFPLIKQGMEAIIAAGGKRLRPAVLFLCARFHHYDLERLVPMAAAIELLHTASLVHDDTIDNALVRRGLPTLNSIIDEGTTVLVGDFLFAKSAVLSTMGGMLRATRIFAESLVTISEGEIEQKFSLHHLTATREQYLKRIYSKTAVLFAAAGEIGAVLSEAPEDDVQRLRHYARQVGMAFQIVDDILDVHSTAEQIGKPTGGDLKQGTVTLPTMLYLETADEAGREEVRRVIEGVDADDDLLRATLARINASGAVERANSVARQYVEEAKAALAGFPKVPARQSLLDLADFAVQRHY
ncbi:MAG: polyprenyl synthetase family protein [Chloroflexia bacterium]